MKFMNKGKEKSLAIGIDLGTTQSCAGVWQHGRVEIITNEKGRRTTPSYVSFTETGEQLTGDAAKSQLGLNSANTIYGAKQLIGRAFYDTKVQNNMKHWPFKVVSGPGYTMDKEQGMKAMIVVTHAGQEKKFAPEEISAIVLMKMKQLAESYLGSKVNDAVVTVPAYFNYSQRDATKQAGVLAGLNVTRIIYEPIAAAVTYVFNKKLQTPSYELPDNILVFDFGGATLDVSLITINNDVFHIKSTVSDNCLGGDSFDDALVKHFADEFEEKHGKDLRTDPKAFVRLRNACERVKCVLWWELETTIEIDSLYESIDFSSQVTRELLEKLYEKLFKNCMECVSECLEKARIGSSDVQNVVLVGGSSRIPKVEHILQDYFKTSHIYRGLNPEVAVAYGAAIISDMITAKNRHSNKKGGVEEPEVTDFTSKSLGIEVYGGNMSGVIFKLTELPTKKTGVYVTSSDNQTDVSFLVYEGECTKVKFNTYLDEFDLTDIPKAPKGKEGFDVYFDVNRAGTLTVSAQHKGTTNRKEIALSHQNLSSLRLNFTRMINEAMVNSFIPVSPKKELIDNNQSFKDFAGAIWRTMHMKLKLFAKLNCFDIKD